MSRSALKNVFKLIDMANNDMPIEKQFLNDLIASIEKSANEVRKPSQTYKPSGMNCVRQMVYAILGVEPEQKGTTYQLAGICESGTDRHIRIQQAIERMKEKIGADCEYIDVETYVKQRNLTDLEIVSKNGMETKLYNKKYNISFMCDGIIRYKGQYYIFEFKTETADKFYKRTDTDPSHYNQATAYSLSFGINQVMFLYENRNTCDLKSYIRKVTEDMKGELIYKIEYCNSYAKQLKAPPKPLDVTKKACSYCIYKKRCEGDCY